MIKQRIDDMQNATGATATATASQASGAASEQNSST
jgi:hypothetical protein